MKKPTGLLELLTPEQRKAALAYDGPQNHGHPAFAPVHGLKYNFGEIERVVDVFGQRMTLSQKAVVPGKTLEDLINVFETAQATGDSLSANPNAWGVTKGIKEVVNMVLDALAENDYLKNPSKPYLTAKEADAKVMKDKMIDRTGDHEKFSFQNEKTC